MAHPGTTTACLRQQFAWLLRVRRDFCVPILAISLVSIIPAGTLEWQCSESGFAAFVSLPRQSNGALSWSTGPLRAGVSGAKVCTPSSRLYCSWGSSVGSRQRQSYVSVRSTCLRWLPGARLAVAWLDLSSYFERRLTSPHIRKHGRGPLPAANAAAAPRIQRGARQAGVMRSD